MGKQWKLRDFIFGGSQITADGDCSHEIKRRLLFGIKVITKLDSILKSRRHYFANKDLSSQGYGFSCGHVWMWELGYKEGWALKNWCCWIVVLEKTLKSPLDCKEIKPVNSKRNQPWIFNERTDAEAETPMLWPSDLKMLGKTEAGGGDSREWDGWMASLIQWTCTCASSGRWWRTGKPGVLQSMWLQSCTRLSDWTINNMVLILII